MGQTSLAFFDLSQMGFLQSLGYIIVISGVFGVIGLYFYKAVFEKGPDVHAERRAKIDARRASTGRSKKNK